MSLGVPDSIVFNEKPRATAASKVRQNFLPINGRVFGPSSQVHFSLACGRKGAFLDPKATYLKFRLTNKDAMVGGNNLALDYSAHSVIHLLETYYGSTQLEYVREYAPLVAALVDSQANTDREIKNATILEGNSGTTRTGTTIAAAGSRVFCIPLLSGLIGSLAEKMLPVGSMTRDNLKFSLTLADLHDIQHGAASADWELSEVELVCEYIMVNPQVATAIESMSPQGIRIPMTTFSLQSNSIATGLSSINLLLSGNFRSVKTLLTVFRPDANRGAAGRNYVSDRSNPIQDTGSWSYDIAGFRVPQRECVGSVETFMELQKAFHSFSSVEGHGIHNNTTWSHATAGSFLIGIDLDHFGGKSMVSESGVDISTSTCYLQAQFQTATTDAMRCDTWFHADAVLFISPDGSSAQTLV